MRGLLIKDLLFLKQQKQLVMILIFLFLIFMISQGKDSAPFVISYMTLMGGMMALNNISYDNYDGSTAFLLTLPITRKQYAIEKYLFGIACGASFCLIPTVIYLLLFASDRQEILILAIVGLCVLLLFQMIMVPIQLKFGSEKGRFAILGMVMAVMLLAYGANLMMKKIYHTNLESALDRMFNELLGFNPWAIAGVLILIFAAGFAVSTYISVNIMEKKEF